MLEENWENVESYGWNWKISTFITEMLNYFANLIFKVLAFLNVYTVLQLAQNFWGQYPTPFSVLKDRTLHLQFFGVDLR